MDIEIISRPGSAAAKIKFLHNETISAEGGSMIAMRGKFAIETSTHQRSSGIFGGLRRVIAGESFFLNHYTAKSAGGEILFAGVLPGDMESITLSQSGLIVEGGCFVCKGDRLEMDLSWQGLKSIFSGEKFFWLKIKGSGQIVLSSFGAIYPVEVKGEYIVDTGHIVAFEDSLSFTVSKASKSWLSSYLGGEGLICHFKGYGKLWCQSHSSLAFGRLISPLLKPRSN